MKIQLLELVCVKKIMFISFCFQWNPCVVSFALEESRYKRMLHGNIHNLGPIEEQLVNTWYMIRSRKMLLYILCMLWKSPHYVALYVWLVLFYFVVKSYYSCVCFVVWGKHQHHWHFSLWSVASSHACFLAVLWRKKLVPYIKSIVAWSLN